MSVQRVTRKGKTKYMARWRDEGGTQRAQVFDRKADAEHHEREILRLKRTGELTIFDAGRTTLGEFVRERWWPFYASTLERNTRATYASLWDKHVLPRLGGLGLRELRTEVLQRFRTDLERAGVGPAAIRKTLMLLQGVLQRAVEWGALPTNPMLAVRKPAARRVREVRPPSPAAIEDLRAWVLGQAPHREQQLRHRDATLISVLAYAGLRPQEALALSWGHIREHTLLVERATDFAGNLKSPKTRRARTVALLAPLASDLAEWRLASRRPPGSALVFPAGGGELWRRHDWQNWRNRTFIPGARSTALESTVPYDLRHAFCSLLLAEGRTFIEVAGQLGHAPSMTSDTYGHVIQELAGQRIPAEEQILRARQPRGASAIGA